MEENKIGIKREKILERLAQELGEDFLNKNNGEGRIGLYGSDKKTLITFRDKLSDYFLSTEKRVPIVLGEASYNIDVGFFLHAGYFNGMNKDVNILLQTA